MPHIALDNELPGISGLMAHRPDTGAPLSDLADVLLRAPSSLSPGERELIAAYVSQLNSTEFCSASHGAFAAAQLPGGQGLVEAVLADPATAPVDGRLRALLAVAAEVRNAARPVSDEAIAAARAEGADDTALHDTVLIAAAFCMYNRYVSGLATELPEDGGYYGHAARRIVADGYRGTSARTD
ncbi:alkylhydroperoxidase (plasmid) [Streptomyces finlayi]|uniref:Alkylhydroperoxidase n=1 Tax=Streptomyces finlayi TaxID=67296 RepID=A0A7G7BWB1_9ACTN|nr:carboxymuconolactone decarboxylase family protein [Streptomyces finlayi]QNE79626.1 alkylhydroperoxidase [Streptomyces finlayi]